MDDAAEYERVITKYPAVTARHLAFYVVVLIVLALGDNVGWFSPDWAGVAFAVALAGAGEYRNFRVRQNARMLLHHHL